MDFGPLLLSLEVATIATILATIVGVAAAAVLANFRFVGRDLLDVLFTAPLVMPPTVLGYYLLVLLGRNSFLGTLAGTTILFTKTATILAAAVAAVALVVKNARSALEEVDTTLLLAARTLGATRLRAFVTVQLPLAMRGIVAAVMLAFARAIGEFGITLVLGGNIPGKTRTAPLEIYDAIQAHREDDARQLSILLTVIVMALVYAVGKMTARRAENHE